MWFGCRTPGQDLLDSPPCPDGSSCGAPGITLRRAGELSFHRGGTGRFAGALTPKHRILDLRILPRRPGKSGSSKLSPPARSKPRFSRLA